MKVQAPRDTGLLEDGRYEIVREVGAGAFGVVWEALDRRTGQRVAIKSVRWATPDDFRDLKREFRALRDIVHPCLVPLGRLVVDDGRCFYTMELVEGVTLTAALADWRARGGADYRWLARVFRDIADGLGALHAHGKLHRDVKPDNVVVSDAGRARLIDYGLVSHLHSRISTKSREGVMAGTFAYASPEALRGEALSLASDWFGFGVMLHEALSGSLPFSSAMSQALGAAPGTLPPGVPASLEDLCRRLLAAEAVARPGHGHVGARLAELMVGEPAAGEATPDRSPRDVSREDALFIGRAESVAQLEALAREADTRPVLVMIAGESGVGKTRLAEHVLAAEEASGALVLRGRCHPNERVPFNAFDAVADELARVLEHAEPALAAAVEPRDPAPLGRLFPALGRACGVAPAAGAELDASPSLAQAADALAELLARLARRRRVRVLIDDLHWSDRDSVALLGHLLDSPHAPPLFLLATTRVGEDGAPPAPLARLAPAARVHHLVPLEPVDRATLARALAELHGLEGDAVRPLTDIGGGSPYYMRVLAEHAARAGLRVGAGPGATLAAFLADRVAELPATDREVLSLVALAGGPLPSGVLAAVPGLEGVVWSALERLEAVRFVRRAGGRDAVEVWHGAVADAMARALGDVEAVARHGALADAYAASALDAPLAHARHLFAAGRDVDAARVALAGARAAEARQAFAQAASLYEMVLQRAPGAAEGSPELLAQAGRALVHSGRVGRGAELLDRAAALAEARDGGGPWVEEARRDAAYSYLRSGRYTAGRAIFEALLRERGVRWRRTRLGALCSLLWNRLRLRPGRRPSSASAAAAPAAPPEMVERLELMWAAGASLSLYDALRAFDFQARHARLAVRAADPRHLALSVSTRALIGMLEGGRGCEPRALADLAEARTRAGPDPDPATVAHLSYMSSGVAFLRARFADARREARRGVGFCRRASLDTHWERVSLHWLETSARVVLGDLVGASAHLDGLLAEAEMADDFYMRTLLRLGLSPLAYLADGAPERTLSACRAAWEDAGDSGYLDAQFLRGALPAALYRRDLPVADDLIRTVWPLLRRHQVLRLQAVRIDALFDRARLALAHAASSDVLPVVAARARRRARKDAARLMREGTFWSAALGQLVLGQVVALGGDDGARVLFEQAAERFREVEALPHEIAARACAAAGHPDADAVRAELFQRLSERGVAEPLPFTWTLAPALMVDAQAVTDARARPPSR